MGMKRSMQAPLIILWAAFLFHNLGVFVVSELDFEDQKNFFFPDPNARTPPAVPYTPPVVSYTPPTGGSSTPPVPSHGGGGSYRNTPPAHCGNPPTDHHPTPSPPTAGYHHPTPSPPSAGYHHYPPTSTPTPPRTPTISTPPSPPSPFDPHSPPFTCTFWRNHPTLVLAVFGWWGTVGNAFGVSVSTSTPPGVGAQASLLQALSNTRTDGYGELYREGTAALLNSMAHTKFPYTTTHVRDSFVAALSSNKAASAQAQLFKLANEGRIRGRDNSN